MMPDPHPLDLDRRPLYDRTDAELLAALRGMYEHMDWTLSPNDLAHELDRRAAAKLGRVAMVTSIVSAAVATVAVVLSMSALIIGAGA